MRSGAMNFFEQNRNAQNGSQNRGFPQTNSNNNTQPQNVSANFFQDKNQQSMPNQQSVFFQTQNNNNNTSQPMQNNFPIQPNNKSSFPVNSFQQKGFFPNQSNSINRPQNQNEVFTGGFKAPNLPTQNKLQVNPQEMNELEKVLNSYYCLVNDEEPASIYRTAVNTPNIYAR